jgi:isopenicillin-N epimerase
MVELAMDASILSRKDFLIRTGLWIGGTLLTQTEVPSAYAADYTNHSWENFRKLFKLNTHQIHMSHFYLTSHPKPVRNAIEEIRDGLDLNPIEYIHSNQERLETAVLCSAAKYMDVNPQDIALTDSTTMGLGLVYSSLELSSNQEILTTTHDHYSTETALQLRAARTGAKIKRTSLYEHGEQVTTDQLVERLTKNISINTRYVVLTWVHSVTGMKLPIEKICAAIAKLNKKRTEKNRIIVCVDGVHGFGAESISIPELGCDFFIAGTHKWIFGPRGTGLVWAKPESWRYAQATIPSFSGDLYDIWMGTMEPKPQTNHVLMTPGGFHSFEHRWAVDKAFELHMQVGKKKIQDRIHFLNTMLKQGLSKMKKIKLITPMDEGLSAGIVCFEVEGKKPGTFVKELEKHHIIASTTPYRERYARLSPSLVTLEADVEKTLRAIEKLI